MLFRSSKLIRRTLAVAALAISILSAAPSAQAYYVAGAANTSPYSTAIGLAVNYWTASSAVNAALSWAGRPAAWWYSNRRGGAFVYNTANGYGGGTYGFGSGYWTAEAAASVARSGVAGWRYYAWRAAFNY